jgi:hypothetical protein
VLCSGRGTYGGGRCHCETGWAGPECDLPSTEFDLPFITCSIPCGVHGKCVNGRCQCESGYAGASCETCKPIYSSISRCFSLSLHLWIAFGLFTPTSPWPTISWLLMEEFPFSTIRRDITKMRKSDKAKRITAGRKWKEICWKM